MMAENVPNRESEITRAGTEGGSCDWWTGRGLPIVVYAALSGNDRKDDNLFHTTVPCSST